MGWDPAGVAARMAARLHTVAALFAANFLTIVFFLKVFEV